MVLPLISIITVSLNARQALSQTINSVRAQAGTLLEHIIVDGNSSDGTANWLRAEAFSSVRWISEPDAGIYEAMNKGLNLAQGEWVFFLCAGDELVPGVLERIAPLLNPSLDGLIGHVLQADAGRFYGTFSEAMLISNLIHHQAAFYNRRLFDQFRYDTRLRSMSDYELNLLLYKQQKNVQVVDIDVSLCAEQGISAGLLRSLYESNLIKYRHLGFWQGSWYGGILAWKYLIIYLKKIKKKYKK